MKERYQDLLMPTTSRPVLPMKFTEKVKREMRVLPSGERNPTVLFPESFTRAERSFLQAVEHKNGATRVAQKQKMHTEQGGLRETKGNNERVNLKHIAKEE
jgi:hypothetical protein